MICTRCGSTYHGQCLVCALGQQITTTRGDSVNHPQHYTFGKYEVIDVLEDWQLNFHLGNAVKYIARAGKKGDALEDLQKALWYVEREIKRRTQCG